MSAARYLAMAVLGFFSAIALNLTGSITGWERSTIHLAMLIFIPLGLILLALRGKTVGIRPKYALIGLVPLIGTAYILMLCSEYWSERLVEHYPWLTE